ncbi:hypothetical protein FE257_004419 [Aspergillus nanangensis]|uniref:Uncharacterized protein n=1 Tax=Aspergillus nanangensis TaxID=2582783 RepID=A0AAD4CZQ9_ASPNN|nr:hypothetical protein FE257_004419 [Aspergillus nanangensis]
MSLSPSLRLLTYFLAMMPIGFGINAFVRPDHALSFFEFDYPTTAPEKQLLDAMMMVYGARDVFMGLVLAASAQFGTRKSTGWTLIFTGAVAGVDGLVCRFYSTGEWTHWGYAPVLAVLGGFLVV